MNAASVFRQNNSGPGFTAQDGIGIATALIPLVSLFKGSHKSKARSNPVRRRPVSIQIDEQRKINPLWIAGGVAVVLVIGMLALYRSKS